MHVRTKVRTKVGGNTYSVLVQDLALNRIVDFPLEVTEMVVRETVMSLWTKQSEREILCQYVTLWCASFKKK